MTKNIFISIFLAMGLLLCSLPAAQAKKVTYRTKDVSKLTEIVVADSAQRNSDTFFEMGALVQENDSSHVAEAIFKASPNLAFSHFTWGAEFGSSIDLTGHNLSTFDLDINLGFKNSYIKLAGIGCGFHRSINAGDTYIPVYAVLRTSFTRRPSLFFLNLQAGYSFNTESGSKYYGDVITALGCGLNLTQTRRAKSYVILSVGSRIFSKNHKKASSLDVSEVLTGKIVIGINF